MRELPRVDEWLPIEQCKDKHLYIILARNAYLGVYKEKEEAFVISRFKFKDNFLYTENHWDTGSPHGTAKPVKEICRVPDEIFENEERLLEYLNDEFFKLKKELIKSIANLEGWI